MKRKVDVTLLGRRFTVKTEKDEAYVHALATQVSRRLEEIRRQVRGASMEEHALLVAMHLADELSEERERAAAIRQEIRARTEKVVHKLAAALGSASGADVDLGSKRADDGEHDGDANSAVVVAALSRQA